MRRLWRLMFLFAALLAGLAHAAPEYSIKAGYILLFTRYVEWPESAFPSPTAPIVICVLGLDPFGSILDETVAGQHSQKRPLRVRRVANAQEAEDCHVAFIATPEDRQELRQQAGDWIEVLADRPVLTITEHLAALDRGAILSFVHEVDGGQTRISFEASLPSMRRAGLTVSSQMLVAARKVHRSSL